MYVMIFFGGGQQTSANLRPVAAEDLSSLFSIVLTHALSHTTTHYWSWMAACTSWTLQLYTNNLSTHCDPNEVFRPDKHFTTFTLEGDETVLAITVYLTGQ